MALVYFMIFSLTIAALNRISVYSLLQPVILFFHQSCLNRLPEASSALPELRALVCGENFSGASSSQIYISTGLIHLFVVSGAHLLVLEKILSMGDFLSRKRNALIIFSVLFIYTLACEMNPPISRSFISMMFTMLLSVHHLRWPMSYRLLLAGLATLAINPQWVASASLQLSWIAGLVVSINTLYFSKRSFYFKQFLYFIFLWPLLIYLSVPSYFTIFVNLIFTSLLEFILFPLGLLTWLLPFLHVLFDQVIALLTFMLRLLEFNFQPQQFLQVAQLTTTGWFVILILHFCLHLTEIDHRRRNYV